MDVNVFQQKGGRLIITLDFGKKLNMFMINGVQQDSRMFSKKEFKLTMTVR